MDTTQIEHLRGERWRYEAAGALVRTQDGQQAVCDVRGWGALSRKYGEHEAAIQQDLIGTLLALAPELLGEVLDLRKQVAELEQQRAQAHAVPPCDHSGSYLVRDGSMTGTVICGRCGYRREWNAY